jgi:hypothetical protein
MRRTDTEPDFPRPPVCVALDLFLAEIGLNNTQVANGIDTDQSNVSRWRGYTEPDRETVREIEIFAGVRLGTVYRMCEPPYVEDSSATSNLQRLKEDEDLTPANRIPIVAGYEAALEASRKERQKQAEWRKTKTKSKRQA